MRAWLDAFAHLQLPADTRVGHMARILPGTRRPASRQRKTVSCLSNLHALARSSSLICTAHTRPHVHTLFRTNFVLGYLKHHRNCETRLGLSHDATGRQVGIWSAITMAKIRPSRGEKGGGGGGKRHDDRNDQANDAANDDPGGYDDDSEDAGDSSDLVSDSTDDAEGDADDDAAPAAPRGQHQQLSIGAAGR